MTIMTMMTQDSYSLSVHQSEWMKEREWEDSVIIVT
jgi:hypothetical protein